MIIGNRIPFEYFVTSGTGESDITIHAGSFDMALKEAGIYDYNLIKYSSIMPKQAVKVDRPKEYIPGSVLEVIMAEASGEPGETVTAALIIGWVFDKKTGKNLGGLVAEYSGNLDIPSTKVKLKKMIKDMFESRYDSDKFDLGEEEIFIESFVPKKKHGTAIVAICFTSYKYPVLEKEEKEEII